MKDILDFICILVVISLAILIGLIGLFCLVYSSVNVTFNILDKSECSALVDNKNVYNGKCHFLDISGIGENGNTKQLIIYKDMWNLKPLKKYVANDIEIKEREY